MVYTVYIVQTAFERRFSVYVYGCLYRIEGDMKRFDNKGPEVDASTRGTFAGWLEKVWLSIFGKIVNVLDLPFRSKKIQTLFNRSVDWTEKHRVSARRVVATSVTGTRLETELCKESLPCPAGSWKRFAQSVVWLDGLSRSAGRMSSIGCSVHRSVSQRDGRFVRWSVAWFSVGRSVSR